MGIRSALILTMLSSGLTAKRETRPFVVHSHFIHVGSEPNTVHFNSIPSFEFAHLIVIDSSCGRKQERCPRYCADIDLTTLYCEYRCHAMAPQMAMFICNIDNKYYRYNGTSAANPLDRWQWQVSGWRTMYGREYLDKLRFSVFPVFHQLSTQIRIVSSASFDNRALGTFYNGVFGLAPGPSSPLYQITKAHGLAPIATISANYWQSRGNSKWQASMMLTTVGHLDSSRCADWKIVKSLSSDRWVFPIESVDYMGVGLGKAMGTFSYFLGAFASVSSLTIERLVAGGIAEFAGQLPLYQDYYRAMVPCDRDRHILPQVSFNIGKFELVFNESATYRGIDYRARPLRCVHNFLVDHKSPHLNAEVWVFGQDFFREYCVAFDYEKLTIGFAKLRKWPFPFSAGDQTAL